MLDLHHAIGRFSSSQAGGFPVFDPFYQIFGVLNSPHFVKTSGSKDQTRGLTFVEVIFVLFSLCILAALLLATMSAPRVRKDVGCVNQLKLMSQVARVWTTDHNDGFPTAVSSTNSHGTFLPTSGYAEAIFQMSSNELGSPRVLVCPADLGRRPARSFGVPLAATNLSYFVNAEGGKAGPHAFMFGDDNFEIHGARVKSGLLVVSNNSLAWTPDRHRFRGNIALADGSVRGMSNPGLSNFLDSTNRPSMRLAIP